MDTPYQTPASNVELEGMRIPRKKRLKSISPLKLGIVLAALYAVMSLIVVLIILPFTFLGAFSRGGGGAGGAELLGMGFGMLVAAPIIYGIMGFVGGVIVAFVYNVLAKMTGGIEFTVEDVA